jgi:hypothetical protein
MVCDGDVTKESDQQARVVLQWHEVSELSLQGVDSSRRNWIRELDFSENGEAIRCKIELMDGMKGLVIARRVEVREVEAL